MIRRKNILKIAIDSPAAAGAGTQADLISKHYNLLQLDTGRCYRYIAKLKINHPNKYNYHFIKRKIDKLKVKELQKMKLHSDTIASEASIIAKDKKIRKLVHSFQLKCAYNPPKKYSGSVLDGRDITTIQLKNAMFKFFITANLKTRAIRRFKEYKGLNKQISLNEVIKSIKKRDKLDRTRKYGPLKKTKDSILINTTKLSKKACFTKIKAIMDRKLKY